MTRYRTEGPTWKRRDIGPFWVARVPSPLSHQNVSFTVRARGREWTLGIRLPGWVE